MNLTKELLAHIEDMSQAEQKQLLASLNAKKDESIFPSIIMAGGNENHHAFEDMKDNLALLAFAALDMGVEPQRVTDGGMALFETLHNYCQAKRDEKTSLKFKAA